MCPEDENSVSNSNGFCILEGKTCPITMFLVRDKNPVPLSFKEGPKITNTLSIYISKSGSHFDILTPISQIKVSEGRVCMDNDVDSLTPKRTDSPFLRKERSECSDYDLKFITIVNKNFKIIS